VRAENDRAVSDSRNESLARIYDALAWRYAKGDGINDFYTLPIIKCFCPSSARCALEVCCGVGRIAVELAKNVQSVWGIDLSLEMIVDARQRAQSISNRPVFIQGDLSAYDFGAQTFDYIYGAYFTAYFEIGALLQKLIPLTRPGGRIFFIDGLQGPGIGSFRLADVVRQYGDYVRFMRQHGMSVDTLQWFVHRLKRRMFLASKEWKKVERWKREHRDRNPQSNWAEQFLRVLPDAKIEHITPRLTCAIWDRK
jgi:ubiquinone/menaquinone biosynthesis C-methylase UbiE